MIKPEVRERLNNDALVFDNPSFDDSIIGQTFDGRAIYDIELMAKELSDEDGISIDEAMTLLTITQLDHCHMREKRRP